MTLGGATLMMLRGLVAARGESGLHAAICISSALLIPAIARGQTAPPAIVRVQVLQPNRETVPGADVAVIRDAAQAILLGKSDSVGRYSFRIDVDSGHKYSLATRKIGFAPASAPIRIAAGDTLDVDVELEHSSATELPSVRVLGRPNDHFLDATEIAHSKRAIYDAFDAVRKLRPDMLGDRDRCPLEPPTNNVWVNGRRVMFMAEQQTAGYMFGARRSLARAGMSAVPHIAARQRIGLPATDSTLASVKAEHIDQIRWVDCNDHSLPGMGTSNAIFITLKPGVGWDYARGSFVDSSTAPKAPKKPRSD
jgi:carboxypeptidase family protein